jgi:ribosomal protein S18 acetylase RimI-like enzyme
VYLLENECIFDSNSNYIGCRRGQWFTLIKTDILEDSTGIELAKANDRHSIGFMKRDYTLLPKDLEPITEETDAYFIFHSKVPSPIMNSIMCLDRTAKFPKKRVKEIIEFLRRRGNPQLWWLGEHSTQEGVGDTLIENGVERIEWEVPMMAADLIAMDFSQLDLLDESKKIQVKKVTTEEDLENWLAVTQEVYKYSNELIEALRHIYGTRMTEGDSSLVQNFIAEIKGAPVGASSVYLCEGLTGLYYVSTKKEFRGQGVGSAVTLAGMKEGKERGYEVGILGATQLGFGVYQRLGFKEYYKLHLYYG